MKNLSRVVSILLLVCCVSAHSSNVSDEDINMLAQLLEIDGRDNIVSIEGIYDKCPCGESSDCLGFALIRFQKSQKSISRELVKYKSNWALSKVQQWNIQQSAIKSAIRSEKNPTEKERLIMHVKPTHYSRKPVCIFE